MMDRCERHATKLIALKEEKGEWVGTSRADFKITPIEEIVKKKIQK